MAKWSKRFSGAEKTFEPIVGSLSRQRLVDAGHHVVDALAPVRSCSLILEGFAARYRILSNGRRQISALHLPGDFVDLHDFLLARTTQGVVTLSPCRLATIDHETLRATAASQPQLTELLWADTLVDAEVAREWLVAMGRRSALGRMAHLICELYVRLKVAGRARHMTCPLPLTQADLADTLGLSVVHVNRVLKILRTQRLILLEDHTVTILDWHELTRLAEFEAGYLGFGKFEMIPDERIPA
ncbi:MAG: Crp/Fnr family transcriptional regulator [Rhizobiaceae bacterium]